MHLIQLGSYVPFEVRLMFLQLLVMLESFLILGLLLENLIK